MCEYIKPNITDNSESVDIIIISFTLDYITNKIRQILHPISIYHIYNLDGVRSVETQNDYKTTNIIANEVNQIFIIVESGCIKIKIYFYNNDQHFHNIEFIYIFSKKHRCLSVFHWSFLYWQSNSHTLLEYSNIIYNICLHNLCFSIITISYTFE